MEYSRIPCMACLRHPGVGDGRLQEHRVYARHRAPHRYADPDQRPARLHLFKGLDPRERTGRHGADRALAHRVYKKGGERYGVPEQDRQCACPLPRGEAGGGGRTIDVVATDTNIHRQYSDICHDHTVDNIFP